MKHTKGKWRLQKHVEDIEEINYTVESDTPESKYFSICDVYGFNLEQSEANAKLISKAPEMLEALKYAYSLLIDQAENGMYPKKALQENGGKGFQPIESLINKIENE